MELDSPNSGKSQEDICVIFKLVLLALISIVARKIPEETKIKGAKVLRRIFEVVFVHYRLSRMLFFRILKVMYHKLTICIRTSKCHSKCEEDSSRWSDDLPEDIMQNVLQRLCLSDFFCCGAVCLSWQANVDRAIASKSCRPTPELPWLMLCSHPFSTKDNCFLCLTDDQKLLCRADPTYNMKRGDCVGSIDGWLIMADSVLWRPERFMKPWSFYLYNHQSSSFSVNYFFLNPLTGDRVMLPSSKSTLPCHCSNGPGFFLTITASSVPTSQNCFVVSLCTNGHLAFCRPTQKSWTLIDQGEARGLCFRDIQIINGKIYAATSEASKFLMVFDVQYGNGHPSYMAERMVLLEPCPVPNMLFDRRRCTDGIVYISNFEDISLAKDSVSEELYMIFCRTNFAVEEDPFPWHVIFGGGDLATPLQIQAFRVFKLEWKVNGPQWAEVFDLGDKILFVALSGNKMISISSCLNYNGLYDQAFQKNCIYFAYDIPCLAFPSRGESFGVFSLTSRTIKRIPFPKKYPFTQLHTRPVWFTPNPFTQD